MVKAKLLLKTDSVDYYFSKILDNFDQTGIAQMNWLIITRPDPMDIMWQKNGFCWSEYFEMHTGHQRQSTSNDEHYGGTYTCLLPCPGPHKQNRTKEAIDQLISETSKLKSLNLRKETLREIKLLAEAYMVQGDFKNASETWVGYNDFLAEMIASEKITVPSISISKNEWRKMKKLSNCWRQKINTIAKTILPHRHFRSTHPVGLRLADQEQI